MQVFQGTDYRVETLRQQVKGAENQLRRLRYQLLHAERQAELQREQQLRQHHDGGFPQEWMTETVAALQSSWTGSLEGFGGPAPSAEASAGKDGDVIMDGDGAVEGPPAKWPLSAQEYKRYGRQLIMPEIGLPGQLRLKEAKVLIIGAGGLGCPAAAYLAGAGIGTLGLVDGDTVEESNLHRQIAHSTSRIGAKKVDSAIEYLRSLNPLTNYHPHPSHLTPQTALALFASYDLILDCTDHPTSRYLISDASVLAHKPLVSASALRKDGQLIVLNNPPLPPGETHGGPCYRCIYPQPPPPETVLSCGEGGILGPVVGIMGVLQALEAIKVLVAKPTPAQATEGGTDPPRPSLLAFSAWEGKPFNSYRMRGRRKNCAACSASATISTESLTSGSLDYVAFCGAAGVVDVLPAESKVGVKELAQLARERAGGEGRKRWYENVLDVRDETQFGICALEGSVNVPWKGDAGSWVQRAREASSAVAEGGRCFVVCRLGNDSQLATKALRDHAVATAGWKHVEGGFEAWRREVDPEWPDY
ncbi:hypothetical protein MBLNU230_g0851t1 [Neophaeotheca triangularis]